MLGVGIITGLVSLTLLVVAHELGHFLAAKRNGVEVEEFGIGFPPRAVAWRKVDGKWRRLKKKEWHGKERQDIVGDGLIISLNYLPIGGFCQMKGESDAAQAKGSFGRASWFNKTKILFAGVAMNWLVAAVLLTILALVGMPQFMEGQFKIAQDTRLVTLKPVKIETIMQDSPADKAGLKKDDEVVSAGLAGEAQTAIKTSQDLLQFDQKAAGKTVDITVKRDGKEFSKEVKLNPQTESYILGASISGEAVQVSTWSAPLVGIGTTLQLTGETFKGVFRLLHELMVGLTRQLNFDAEVRRSGAKALKAAGDTVSGPVGIVGVLFPAFMAGGPTKLLFLVAIISISLAVMNVLPIPALDGGRWFLISLFKLRKKKLTQAKEEKIVGRAMLVILLLAIVVTILDVVRMVR